MFLFPRHKLNELKNVRFIKNNVFLPVKFTLHKTNKIFIMGVIKLPASYLSWTLKTHIKTPTTETKYKDPVVRKYCKLT